MDVPVRRGAGYRLAFWAKADKLAAGTVSIAFAQAARRASPETKILAGIGYLNDGQILDDFRHLL